MGKYQSSHNENDNKKKWSDDKTNKKKRDLSKQIGLAEEFDLSRWEQQKQKTNDRRKNKQKDKDKYEYDEYDGWN